MTTQRTLFFIYHKDTFGIVFSCPVEKTPFYGYFQKNSFGKIFPFQKNDKNMYGNIMELCNKHSDVLVRIHFKRWYEKIGPGDWFMTVPDVMTPYDILLYEKVLLNMNGLEPDTDFENRLELSRYFNMTVYGKERSHKILPTEKCRFCGKTREEATFKNTAHAFSSFLGNERVFCYDECDECNRYFGEKVEPEMRNYLIKHIVFDMDKNFKKKLRGKNFIREWDYSPHPKTGEIVPHLSISLFGKEPQSSVWKFDTTGSKWRYQVIYKCLVKYALSVPEIVIPAQYQATIKWVRGDKFVDKLPDVGIESTGEKTAHPILFFYHAWNPHKELPHIFVRFFCFNLCFTYQIPLFENGRADMSKDTAFKEFINDIAGSPEIKWYRMDSAMKMNTRFEICEELLKEMDMNRGCNIFGRFFGFLF